MMMILLYLSFFFLLYEILLADFLKFASESFDFVFVFFALRLMHVHLGSHRLMQHRNKQFICSL